ncbi:MAG TPA: methyltransferase domain-containing protein [Solirubrobacteraceae bacterium]|nr:methyltransferase domain-containing protein [Solirubrobacteraceae bacterium]
MRDRLDDLVARAVGRTLPERVHAPVMSALRSLLWRGDAVQCPCCGGRWVTFLPYWNRDNCRCPRCDSHERHRALWLDLRERDLRGDLLHLAPEEAIARHLRRRPALRYVSADLESPLAMLHFDIQDIPFRDATFDVVLCGHVLTEVPDDRRAMREMRRVLRPGGWAVVMAAVQPGREHTDEDPSLTDPQARRARFLEPTNVRLYGADFADRLREAGFEVDVVPVVRSRPPAEIRRFGLLEADDLYLCRPR